MQNASESEWDVHISLVLMFACVKDKRKSRTEEMSPCYSHNTHSFFSSGQDHYALQIHQFSGTCREGETA